MKAAGLNSLVPGAMQHVAQRSAALQNRDRHKLGALGDPGSAQHHCAPAALRAAARPGHETEYYS